MYWKKLLPFLRYASTINYCNQHTKYQMFMPALTSFRFKNNFDVNRKSDIYQKDENTLTQFQSVLGKSVEHISAIKSFKHVNEVLQFLESNPIDPNLYASIFSVLLQLQQSGNTDYSNSDLCKRNEIELLSQNVKKKIRFLNINDLLSILNSLIILGVSSNSILCQHIFQMLTKNINQLTLKHIIFLKKIVNSCTSCPLIDGLNIALPVIFENNVRTQLEYENPAAVSLAITFAFNQNIISKETLQLLVEIARNIKDKFNCKQAYMILSSLCQKRIRLNYQVELYNEMMNNVNENMGNELSFKEVQFLVYQSINMYLFFNVIYYNEKLIAGAINYVIKNQLDIASVGILLKHLNRISYECYTLIDYMDELLKNIDNFDSLNRISPFIGHLAACANLSYRPKFWKMYEKKLISYFESQKDASIPLPNVTINLILMKCWVPSLIEYCFSEAYLHNLLKKENPIDYKVILNLYQFVLLFYPGKYNNVLPSSDIIQKAISLDLMRDDFPLIGSLANALGGYEFILNGVQTRLGHYLDHIIVKRKDGRLFAINKDKNVNSSKTLVESLNIPQDSFLIGILLLSPSSYCLDGIKIRGKVKLLIHSLEAMGIAIIPVSHTGWNNLADDKKILYLLNKIETKILVQDVSHKDIDMPELLQDADKRK